MEDDSFDWVTENLYELVESQDEECKYIYGLHLLLADVENDGLRGYLMNSSGDSFSYVRGAFDVLDYVDGQVWASALEDAFGGVVPVTRDGRIRRVLPLMKSQSKDDPFDKLSETIDELVPELEIMLSHLVQKKKSDSGWRPDPATRLGGHVGNN